MTLNPIDFDTAQRIVGLVGAWGYQARALATTRWGMSSDDRETVRRRVRLLSAALRSGRLSRADQQSVRADRTVLRSWLRRTWWPQVRYYQLATRLDVLFPEWAERVQREHRPAPEVEAAWFEGPDPVIDPLWRVIVPELRASDVARLQRVVDAWGGDRELMVDDPHDRFGDAQRCVYEVRVARVARSCRRLGGRASLRAESVEEDAGLWLLGTGATVDGRGEGRLMVGGYSIEVDDLTAEEAGGLVELLKEWGYRQARTLNARAWWSQSLPPDGVRHSVRIARMALRSGLLTPDEAAMARQDLRRYRAWLLRRRWWSVGQVMRGSFARLRGIVRREAVDDR